MKLILYITAALVILIIFYLWLIKPARKRPDITLPFCGIYYAHRGLHNIAEGIPENSLPAFKAAAARGYGIELDVQLTKDDQVVVFHDDLLSRICGIDLPVREQTYEQLLKLDLFFTNEKIPLLEDVLNIVNGSVPLLIELKMPVSSQQTCKRVNETLKSYDGPYCIESFNTFALSWYKKHRPDIMRGQLSCNLTKTNGCAYVLSFITKYLLGNFMGRPDFISYCYRDSHNISFLLLKKLFRTVTFGWTIDSMQTFCNNKRTFDSFIFENFYFPKDFQ